MKPKSITTRRKHPNQLTRVLLIRARNELKNNPEAYAFFILSLGAGLRAVEIPLMRWGDFTDGILNIPSVNLHSHSTEARSVPVSPEVIEELESLRPDGVNHDDYIVTCVNSTHPLREKRHLPTCREAFKNLTRWLRRQGLPPEPIELLRKLYGFRVLSSDDPDSFKRAAIYLGLEKGGMTK